MCLTDEHNKVVNPKDAVILDYNVQSAIGRYNIKFNIAVLRPCYYYYSSFLNLISCRFTECRTTHYNKGVIKACHLNCTTHGSSIFSSYIPRTSAHQRDEFLVYIGFTNPRLPSFRLHHEAHRVCSRDKHHPCFPPNVIVFP